MADDSNLIEALQQIAYQPYLTRVRWLQKHITMGRCALLEWAADQPHQPDFDRAGLAELLDTQTSLQPALQWQARLSDGQIKVFADCYPLYAARLSLINAFIQDDANLESAIRQMAKVVAQSWQYVPVTDNQPVDRAKQPVIGLQTPNHLEPSFMKQITAERCRSVLRDIATATGGWSHPGIQMAGEILASLSGDHRKPEVTVRTKIMFAWNDYDNPQGVLAEIILERLPDGCGVLLPDAYRCGYLNMDGKFSTGLQNALWAVRNFAASHLVGSTMCQFDWRWSIDLHTAVQTLPLEPKDRPLQLPLLGPSAEVAFACAMIASHVDNPDNAGGHDPLDPHVGVTASIASLTWGTDKLKGVGSVDVKTIVGPMQHRHLLEVVIAKDQDKTLIPKTNKRLAFPEADSLADAYRLMTRHRRLTRGVNAVLQREAKRLLKSFCTPWIRPAICEIVADDKRKDQKSEENVALSDVMAASTEPPVDKATSKKRAKRRLLNRRQRVQLTTGQLATRSSAAAAKDDQEATDNWVGNRVRLFADSGLGKSMFILYCEYRIAASDNGLLPLRLGRTTGLDSSLGDITWNGNPDGVLDALADRLKSPVKQYLEMARTDGGNTSALRQKELDISQEDVRTWFRWMVKQGKVVFLLDALDQVSDGVPGLGAFLGSGDRTECPVIMTGRPEVLRGRKEAFMDNLHWRTLELQPFNDKRQKRYLGELADELISGSDEVDWQSDADEIRRHQWKDLLETPLLLQMLKQIAVEESPLEPARRLQDITSRYELYDLAVRHLIGKGWTSIEAARQEDLLESKERLREILGQVAWAMARRHDPTNFIEGPEYTKLREAYHLNKDGNLKALHQVDVITEYQVLDRADEGGLAFRHRSFLEFFAGCHLMDEVSEFDRDSGEDTIRDRVPADSRRKILSQIHETCDQNGNLLSFMQGDNNDRPSMWRDTLRFALSHANEDRREELALELIELGNPWLVYQSLLRDTTPFSAAVQSLSRWLVHRDWPNWFDYRQAVGSDMEVQTGVTKAAAAGAVAAGLIDLKLVTDRSTRDAAYLYSLRELLPDGVSLYASISKEAWIKDGLKSLCSGKGTFDFTSSFATIQAGTFDLSGYTDHASIHPQQQQIPGFELADFPVTNELFELFCPTHRRQRDQYSNQDDQPVVQVNWFMATEFCAWLSALTGEKYRLPTEWEWEWACRWHNTRPETFWWGSAMRDDICWYAKSSGYVGSRGRGDTIAALKNAGEHHPSDSAGPELLDLSGNVWEWCSNPYDANADPSAPGSSRVLRGGSWLYDADFCRSAYRFSYSPDDRSYFSGFRVCRG